MRDFPFTEETLGQNEFLRHFRAADAEEMVWHQDPEDRIVKLVEGSGWMLQLDDQLPVAIMENAFYFIPELCWHRLIALPGCTDLKIIVRKLKLSS